MRKSLEEKQNRTKCKLNQKRKEIAENKSKREERNESGREATYRTIRATKINRHRQAFIERSKIWQLLLICNKRTEKTHTY